MFIKTSQNFVDDLIIPLFIFFCMPHRIILFLKSYLMGCAFDMYSQSWSDRSYGLILCFLCWLFPLSIIFSSYVGILYRTRSSYKNVLLRTKTFRESNSEQPTIRADNETERDLRRKTLSTSTLSTKSKMELFKVIL